MNLQAHVRKTPKGEEEIHTRAHKLDHHLRFVLILVDGTSTVEAIVAKGAGMPDVVGSLAQLAAQGYVAIDGESAAAAGGGARHPAEAKAELIAVARELLGADAGKVVSKLEAAPDTKEALLEVAGQCKKVVKLLIDEKKADELMTRCASIIETL
jgi:hypothetical protein